MAKKKPKAGPELGRILKLGTEIVLDVQKVAAGKKLPPLKLLDDTLARLEQTIGRVEAAGDEAKALMDRFILTGRQLQDRADLIQREVDLLQEVSDAILRTVVDAMRDQKLERIEGPQWVLLLNKGEPQLSVSDPAKMAADGSSAQFLVEDPVTGPRYDKAALMKFLAEGGKIEGAELRPSYELAVEPVKVKQEGVTHDPS